MRAIRGALAGAVLLVALPASAFVNGDFEQGSLNGWTTQIFACGSSSPPTAMAVGPGVAPNTCGLLTLPYAGSFCAQLFSGYLVSACTHSVLEQQAVVPFNQGCLSLFFASVQESAHTWKGASCNLAGNSFVKFEVTVGSTVLYSDCFDNCSQLCNTSWPAGCAGFQGCQFNGTPGGTMCSGGCSTGGGTAAWSVLPWCNLFYWINGFQGQIATIRMEAWECSYGGHRSYGYLDEVIWSSCVTQSPTPTNTRTFTNTPTPTPNPMMAAIYSENGEQVKFLMGNLPQLAAPAAQVEPQTMEFPGLTGAPTVTIRLGTRSVTWDGTREMTGANPVAVESGTYFLRAWYYDLTGVAREEVVPIYVYRRDAQVKLLVYGPNGEELASVAGSFASFPIKDLKFCPGDGGPLAECAGSEPFSPGDTPGTAGALPNLYPVVVSPGGITLSAAGGGLLRWDGKVHQKDEQGNVVSWTWAENGTYLGKVEYTGASGRRHEVSWPITVLKRNRNLITATSVVPNPVTGSGVVWFEWETNAASVGEVVVYDVAGKRVASVAESTVGASGVRVAESGPKHRAKLDVGGTGLARGVYVAVVKAKEIGGSRTGRATARFAVQD